ncbi:hypothetical protein MTAT_19740 [Moorella thermoacetica]|uniref:Uncharacterized protein n=1 Tax=Neomoorella thermoacetica TaxID=1525 RepID=A0AAC9MVD8_NEOTH|nr:hypothetical protein [Moorella thermoacetica]AOQ24629.1 hypothetical protein Maut_02201 [Moorella thermoacetica]TYL12732.1 hypothetical protein MTAT_19740 [Moorella thermoacetica]
MAVIRIVPEEEMRVLQKYLNFPAVVLLSETIAKKLSHKYTDGVIDDYDFGGDPDVRVDIVDDIDHYFLVWGHEDVQD